MYRRHYRNNRTADRFDNYRETGAHFPSTGTCGHEISKGDRTGWHPVLKKTQCAACWSRWVTENAEADMLERGCV